MMNNEELIELLNDAGISIYITTIDTMELIYMNNEMKKMSKYIPQLIEGEKCYKVLNGFERQCPFCSISKMKEDEFYVREFHHPFINKTFEMRGTLKRWDGQLVHVEYVRDITKEKQTEELRDELMNNVPAGMCMYFFDGKKLNPISHNEKFYEILGYSKEHIKSVQETTNNLNVHPDDIKKLNVQMQKAFKKGGLSTFTYRLFHDKNQRYIYLKLSANIIKNSDGTAVVYANYEDITEIEDLKKKELEEVKVFNSLERDASKYRVEMLGSAKYNLTKNIVIDHEPGSMPVPHVENNHTIEEFNEIIIPAVADEPNDILILKEKLSRNYLINAKHNGEIFSYRFYRRINEDRIIYCMVTAKFVDSPKTNDEYAVMYTYDITDQIQQEELVEQLVKLNYDFISLFDCKTQKQISSKIGRRDFNKEDIDLGKYPPKNLTYNEASNLYLNNFFEEKEKKLFKENMNFEHIKEELKNKIVYTFTCETNDGERKRQKLWTVGYLDERKDKFILARADVTGIYKDNIEKTEQLNKTTKQLKEAKVYEQKYKEEVAYLESARSNKLLVKVRVNVTKNIIESYLARNDVGITAKDIPYNIGIEQLAQTAFSKEEADDIRNHMNRDRVLKAFDNGERGYNIDYRRKTSEGSILWVNTMVRTFSNPETGDIISFMYSYDINSEHIKDDMLTLVTGMEFDYVAHIDLNTDKCYLYEESTSSTEILKTGNDLYAQSNEKLNLSQVVDEDYNRLKYDTSFEGIKEHLESKNSFSSVYSYNSNDGKVLKKQLQYAYIDKEIKQLVITRTDVTQLYKEQEKNHLELTSALLKAQKASRAKSDFLARASHDMRTPMNGILGLAQLAKDRNTVEELKKDMDQISLSGNYLLNLINDILDMNQIEHGQFKMHPTAVEGKLLLQNIIGNVDILSKNKGIDFKFNINVKDSNWTHVYVDGSRIEQMLMNILSNAVKYTPVGGSVHFTMNDLTDNDEIIKNEFIIEDNGIGMSKEFLKHVCEPFAKENRINTDREGGTGLGMSIAKNIVELLNGNIKIESTVGIGTKVTILVTYPIAKPEKIVKKTIQELDVLYGKRILLVEDHPLNAEIAKRLLEKKKMIVDWVDNGEKGVYAFNNNPDKYAAILMDIRMPVMDGLKAAKVIRGLPKKQAKTIPIIAMTANAFDEDVEKSKKAGMNGHLSKPINSDSLYEYLANEIKNR